MASPSPQTYDGDPIVEQGLSKDVHKQKLVHVDLLKNRDNRHLKPLFVRGRRMAGGRPTHRIHGGDEGREDEYLKYGELHGEEVKVGEQEERAA